MTAVSPTFEHLGSVFVVVASVALGHSAVTNEEVTVFEHPILEEALLHQNNSFHGVLTSRTRGPCILPRFIVLVRQEQRKVFTFDLRVSFWDSRLKMDKAYLFWSTLLTFTAESMMMDLWL